MQSDLTRTPSSNSIIEKAAVLLVFTRTPVPGRVKARLLPAIDIAQAVTIHVELLRRTLETASHSSAVDIELWCTPTTRHPVLSDLEEMYSLTLQTQTGADLGERMCFAMEQAMDHYRQALLIGSDCVDLTTGDIDLALEKMNQGYDVVLGPASDGGYYLIGLTRLYRQLFMDIAWGTDAVLGKTRERVAQLRLQLYELPERHDIDRPEDLRYM